MRNLFTPNDIDVLMHYHYSPFEHPRRLSRAVTETVGRYLREGIIERRSELELTGSNPALYKLTPRGKAWLSQILNVPFPQPAWLDANGEVIS